MRVFVVGDVHGHAETLASLLRDAGLVDRALRWTGRDARLWLVGDLVDRGPDGIGAIDLVMRLEREGPVRCLLGNHEAMLLAARRFPSAPLDAAGYTFLDVWEVNGGRASDLARLTPERVAWLEERPALARDGDWLLLHSDTDRYLELGSSVGAICETASAILRGPDYRAAGALLDAISDRGAFADPGRVERVLGRLGGERVVHGHTPITLVTGQPPESVTGPLAYGGGRVLNVDPCFYAGGRGFVAELDAAARASQR